MTSGAVRRRSRLVAAAAVGLAAGAPALLAAPASAATNPTTPITIAVGDQPTGIAADYVTHMVYVANRGSNTVSVIDEATGAVTATIAVGAAPVAVAIVEPGTVYVANRRSRCRRTARRPG